MKPSADISFDTKVAFVGNSVGVRLSKPIINAARLEVGAPIRVRVVGGSVVIEPRGYVKPVYSLAELVAQCNPRAKRPADIVAFDRAAPCGKEIW